MQNSLKKMYKKKTNSKQKYNYIVTPRWVECYRLPRCKNNFSLNISIVDLIVAALSRV